MLGEGRASTPSLLDEEGVDGIPSHAMTMEIARTTGDKTDDLPHTG
jgi:hypothetical protein